MLNILVWLIMIFDILILAENKLRHTTLYLMVLLDCILSYRAGIWLSVTLSFAYYITSKCLLYHASLTHVVLEHNMFYHELCYMVLYDTIPV